MDATAITQSTTNQTRIGPFRPKRLFVALVLLILAIYPGVLGEITRGLMVDAYTQVAVFVSATFLIFYGAERLFKFDIGDALKNAKGWQVPLASLLGATPGCGGAVIVLAAYSSGNVGFGAVVAALTATMGDAAFLLIATRPEVAIVVLPLSLGVGVLSGYVVDAFSRTPYLGNPSATCALAPLIGRSRKRDYLAFALFVPGLVVGITQLTGADVYEVWGQMPTYVGLAGVVQPLVVVVDGDRQHALGVELPDHIIIQHLADFARGWHVAGLLDQRRLGFLADDVVAQLHTFIADEHGRARDELPHLVLALATEAAVKRAFAIGAAQLRHDVPSSRRPAIADNIRTGMLPA